MIDTRRMARTPTRKTLTWNLTAPDETILARTSANQPMKCRCGKPALYRDKGAAWCKLCGKE